MSEQVRKKFTCRTCLSKNVNVFCIFKTKVLGMLDAVICDMVRDFASIQIEKGDGLPDKMCVRCVEELTRAFLFRQVCVNSNAQLRGSEFLSEEYAEDDPDERSFVVSETSQFSIEKSQDGVEKEYVIHAKKLEAILETAKGAIDQNDFREEIIIKAKKSDATPKTLQKKRNDVCEMPEVTTKKSDESDGNRDEVRKSIALLERSQALDPKKPKLKTTIQSKIVTKTTSRPLPSAAVIKMKTMVQAAIQPKVVKVVKTAEVRAPNHTNINNVQQKTVIKPRASEEIVQKKPNAVPQKVAVEPKILEATTAGSQFSDQTDPNISLLNILSDPKPANKLKEPKVSVPPKISVQPDKPKKPAPVPRTSNAPKQKITELEHHWQNSKIPDGEPPAKRLKLTTVLRSSTALNQIVEKRESPLKFKRSYVPLVSRNFNSSAMNPLTTRGIVLRSSRKPANVPKRTDVGSRGPQRKLSDVSPKTVPGKAKEGAVWVKSSTVLRSSTSKRQNGKSPSKGSTVGSDELDTAEKNVSDVENLIDEPVEPVVRPMFEFIECATGLDVELPNDCASADTEDYNFADENEANGGTIPAEPEPQPDLGTSKANCVTIVDVGQTKCDKCGIVFDDQISEDIHVCDDKDLDKRSLEETTFRCEYCGKFFTEQIYLSNHLLIHTSNLPSCKVCSKVFTTVANLKQHQEIHTAAKVFLCNVCGKRYTEKATLQEHLESHGGGQTYKCEECEKPFTRLAALKMHRMLHTGNRPFGCKVCGKHFKSNSSRASHMETHVKKKPLLKCDSCEKLFADGNRLRQHMKIHNGEKPYECEVCGKRFVRLNTLVCHARIHTGERPYICEKCGRTFRHDAALRMHSKLLHKIVK